MRLIFLDYETYWTDDYSLRKLTPVEYCLDPRFELHGVAVLDEGKTFWLDGPDVGPWLSTLDPNEVAFVSHNALFDMCINAWRYNFVPKLMIDTLGMCRATIAHKVKSLSLASVRTYLDMSPKGDAVMRVKGLPLEAIKSRPDLYKEYMTYALDDVAGCAAIFQHCMVDCGFPRSELKVMDMVLRCAIQPKFRLDMDALGKHYGEVIDRKNFALAQAMLLGVESDKELASSNAFAELLIEQGVDPPTKISPTTGKDTWAFAKTDAEFVALLEHENVAVQVLVGARLGIKSTLEETRTQRFIKIGSLTWQGNEQYLMPMPLKYSGAHTHRLGGDWKLNVQNMSRYNKIIPGSGQLRKALIAPPNHVVLSADASQIEARGVAVVAEQWDLVKAFERDEDVYSSFAEDIYGFPVTKKTHPDERFVGKQGILQLGYGAGAGKFRSQIKAVSRAQTGKLIELSEDQSQQVVTKYRRKYSKIKSIWKWLNDEAIPVLAGSGSARIFAGCNITKGEVTLPNGLKLFYRDLAYVRGEWRYTYGGFSKRLYGGALLENIIQSLARLIVMEAAVRVEERTGYMFALQVHDELVYIVPADQADYLKGIVMEELRRRPTWLPAWPLNVEAGYGPNYGEAK